MSQVKVPADLTNIDDNDEFRRFASILLSDMADSFNGNIEFEKNILSNIKTVKTQAADEWFRIPHTLNKKDVDYIVVGISHPAIVYKPIPNIDTFTDVYLKCNVGYVTVKVILI